MTRIIIRKYLSGNSAGGRKAAGIILGTVGIIFDLLLFGIKCFAGILSGSVAITADAFNNLTDAGAHIMALIGFTLAARKPSRRFPYGCGRLEYLSGLLIAAAILFVSVKMAASSFEKILHPEKVDSSPLVIGILLLAIAVKGYMYRYNKIIGGRIDSAALRSVALDSICDCFATGTIVLSVIIQNVSGINIDGWAGLLVAACIFYAGVVSAKESLLPLMGLAADDEIAEKLYEILCGFPEITGITAPAIHDYGPDSRLLTVRLTGKLSAEKLRLLHDRIREGLGAEAVIEIDENE